jgi:hypothetical protein
VVSKAEMKNCLHPMTLLLKRREMKVVVKVGYQILRLQEWGCDLDPVGFRRRPVPSSCSLISEKSSG